MTIEKQNKLPANARPDNIGKVVVVQVFDRKYKDADEISLETLDKTVGILEAYACNKNGFSFKIQGCDLVWVPYAAQVVEIYEP